MGALPKEARKDTLLSEKDMVGVAEPAWNPTHRESQCFLCVCLLSFKFNKHDFHFQLGFILISNSNRFIQASVFLCVCVCARARMLVSVWWCIRLWVFVGGCACTHVCLYRGQRLSSCITPQVPSTLFFEASLPGTRSSVIRLGCLISKLQETSSLHLQTHTTTPSFSCRC